ncbi:MAG TPA: hypothetical protein VFS92_05515 [Planctomycetota bacterium]|nr:hypothetical protein [Planctomycetota bacterium]
MIAFVATVCALWWPSAHAAAAAGEWLRRRWGGAAPLVRPPAGFLRGAVAYAVGVIVGLLAAWFAFQPPLFGTLALVLLGAGAPTAGLLAARAVLRGREPPVDA